MTTNHHTPIANGMSNDAGTWETPLAELDAAIGDLAGDSLLTGSTALAKILTERVQRLAADNTLDSRIDNLGVEAGNANAEVTAARTAIEYGTSPASLSAALRFAAKGEFNLLAYDSVGNIETGATDCVAAFNLALDAIETAGGGTLIIPPGAYVTSEATPIKIPSNTRIVGAGVGRTTITSTATTSQVTGIFVNRDWDTGTGWTANENIEISGIKFVQTSRQGSVTANCNIIALGHVTNAWVHHCQFIDYYYHCVDCTGSKNVWITDNTAVGNTGGAADSNSAFQIDQAAASSIYGINADNTPSSYVFIINNKVISDNYSCVHFHRDGHRHTIIQGNHFEASWYGIRSDSVLNYNHEEIVIAGNVFRDITNRCVSFPTTVRSLSVTGNVMTGADYGVYVSWETTAQSTGIAVASNTFRAVENPIYIKDSWRVAVTGNVCDFTGVAAAGAAIYLDNVRRASVTGNQINGIASFETFTVNGIDLDSTTGAGGSYGVVIVGNQIHDCDTGIDVADDCQNVKVHSNGLTACATSLGIGPNHQHCDHDFNLFYDSGWFAITDATKYGNGTATPLAHNFGVVPRTVKIYYVSSSANPTNDTRGALDNRSHLIHGMYYSAGGAVGMIVTSLNGVDMILQTGAAGCYAFFGAAGTLTALANGYARVIASA